MSPLRVGLLGLLAASCLSWASISLAYDEETHRALMESAVDPSRSSVHSRLADELGMEAGIFTILPGIGESGPRGVQQIIGDGALSEDQPALRSLNHFHNPVRPWSEAGLRVLGLQIGRSSVLWQQSAQQAAPAPGGSWSWPDARRRFLEALTTPFKADQADSKGRDRALSETFATLGHLGHLIQDGAVPAHVRNDPHPSLGDSDKRLPINPDWYEDWITDTRKNRGRQFTELLNRSPARPESTIFVPGQDPAAPVPIAALIDGDRFTGDDPLPLSGPDLGLAEYTNGNFLSRDTRFKNFALPRPASLDRAQPLVEPSGNGQRRYFTKVTDGETVAHFVTEGALYQALAAEVGTPPVGGWMLDDRVHQDYAALLLPRAIGYSAALLDYFFRGRLDVELVEDPVDPSVVRLVGSNASPEALDGGTLALYGDSLATGRRTPATTAEPATAIAALAGGPMQSAAFQMPPDAERLVAVYTGKLGDEAPTSDSPGAVIGKVLGGVRVEQIVPVGEEWKLRTPKGVFGLQPPLRLADWELVKWGDGPNTLVARTRFGPDRPNRVASFEVVRLPNTVDVAASGSTPDTMRVPLAAGPSVTLPAAGIPTGTTVSLDQTWTFRQQIVRIPETRYTYECEDGTPGRLLSVESTPPELELVTQRTVSIPVSLALVLDPAHYWESSPVDYAWDLADIGADAKGRPLAVVSVFGTRLQAPTVPVSHYVIDPISGAPVEHSQSLLSADYPPGSEMLLWALVDLTAGQVLASTAGPQITLRSHKVSEGHPLRFTNGAFGFVTQVTSVACETKKSNWMITLPPIHLSPGDEPEVSLHLEERVGEDDVAITGLLRPDLRQALAAVGFGDAAITSSEIVERIPYHCRQSDPIGDCVAIEVRSEFPGVGRTPANLDAALRSAGGGSGRLVILAKDTGGLDPDRAALAVMDVGQPATAVRHQPHGQIVKLRGVNTSTAVVTEEDRFGVRRVASSLVPLDGSRSPVVFPGQRLDAAFVLLEPTYLFNRNDLKFYRLRAPLMRTALPAALASGPRGDLGHFHAVKIP